MVKPETETETRTITAHCHCKSTRYACAIVPAAFTRPGTLCIFHALLPILIYPHSVGSTTTTRYFRDSFLGERRFCTTYGCHIGDCVESLDMWYIAIAPFPRDENVFLIDEHLFTWSAPAGLYDRLHQGGTRGRAR